MGLEDYGGSLLVACGGGLGEHYVADGVGLGGDTVLGCEVKQKLPYLVFFL